MKKIMVFLLAFMLTCGAAFAEAMIPEGAVRLEMDAPLEMDLDDDGAAEKISVRMQGAEYEETLQLLIEGSDGAMNVFNTGIAYVTDCIVVDMNGDGIQEILLSGDEASDDYFTWCLNYSIDNGISILSFADANRGENTDEYFISGYGKIVSLDESTITLMGSQDVLGTWMCSRVFTLKDGRFELEDGGKWIMNDITGEEYVWDYFCLNPIQEVPVTFEDGSEGALEVGEKFVITETDKLTYASFITQQGKKGSIVLEENLDEGWGHKIAGIADYEYFEYIPYAD